MERISIGRVDKTKMNLFGAIERWVREIFREDQHFVSRSFLKRKYGKGNERQREAARFGTRSNLMSNFCKVQTSHALALGRSFKLPFLLIAKKKKIFLSSHKGCFSISLHLRKRFFPLILLTLREKYDFEVQY